MKISARSSNRGKKRSELTNKQSVPPSTSDDSVQITSEKWNQQWHQGSRSLNWAHLLPHAWIEFQSGSIGFLQTEKNVLLSTFFSESRDPFWHPVQHLEQTDERRTREFELKLTRRHAGRHAAHHSQPRAAGMDTSVCLDIDESREQEKTPTAERDWGKGNLRYRQWNKYRGTNQSNRSVYPIRLL